LHDLALFISGFSPEWRNIFWKWNPKVEKRSGKGKAISQEKGIWRVLSMPVYLVFAVVLCGVVLCGVVETTHRTQHNG